MEGRVSSANPTWPFGRPFDRLRTGLRTSSAPFDFAQDRQDRPFGKLRTGAQILPPDNRSQT